MIQYVQNVDIFCSVNKIMKNILNQNNMEALPKDNKTKK